VKIIALGVFQYQLYPVLSTVGCLPNLTLLTGRIADLGRGEGDIVNYYSRQSGE
jgi:hypothetical protein